MIHSTLTFCKLDTLIVAILALYALENNPELHKLVVITTPTPASLYTCTEERFLKFKLQPS